MERRQPKKLGGGAYLAGPSEAVPKIACAADETKFWLTPSAQLRNPCFGPPTVYQDLSTRHDNWPVQKIPLSICQ